MASNKMPRLYNDRTWVVETNSVLYNSIAVTFRNLQVFGMYPTNNVPKWVYNCYAIFLECILTLPVPMLTFTYMFVNRETLDLITVIDMLFMVMEMFIAVPKYMLVRFNSEAVRNTIEWLNRKEFTTCHPDQGKIPKEISDLFKKVFYCFLVACVVTLFVLVFKPLLMGQKMIPTVIWLPFDPSRDYYVFVAIYCLVALGIISVGIGNCSMDCLIVGLIFHATGQLQIIKGALKDVAKHAEEKGWNEHGNLPPAEFKILKNKYIYEEICQCVDRYNLVKEFAKDIEDTYSFYLFLQFAASIIVIGFACIQFYLVELWSVQFYLIVLWITCMTWEVFLYCFFGSLLYFESLTFNNDIYLTDWLELDQKSQRAYLIIMESAKRPIMIKAGKMIELSLDTFATIMRRSYSLLALCNKLL